MKSQVCQYCGSAVNAGGFVCRRCGRHLLRVVTDQDVRLRAARHNILRDPAETPPDEDLRNQLHRARTQLSADSMDARRSEREGGLWPR